MPLFFAFELKIVNGIENNYYIYTMKKPIDIRAQKLKHERALRILVAIEGMEQRRLRTIFNIESPASELFPQFRAHYINRADTLQRCVDRLTETYIKHQNQTTK